MNYRDRHKKLRKLIKSQAPNVRVTQSKGHKGTLKITPKQGDYTPMEKKAIEALGLTHTFTGEPRTFIEPKEQEDLIKKFGRFL